MKRRIAVVRSGATPIRRLFGHLYLEMHQLSCAATDSCCRIQSAIGLALEAREQDTNLNDLMLFAEEIRESVPRELRLAFASSVRELEPARMAAQIARYRLRTGNTPDTNERDRQSLEVALIQAEATLDQAEKANREALQRLREGVRRTWTERVEAARAAHDSAAAERLQAVVQVMPELQSA